MIAEALASMIGADCESYLRAIAFSRRNGPGTLTPEQHACVLRRMENTAAALATVAGHYGNRAVEQYGLWKVRP